MAHVQEVREKPNSLHQVLYLPRCAVGQCQKKGVFCWKTLESLFLRRPLLGRDRQDTVDMYNKYCSKNTCWNTKWRPLTF